MRYDVTTFGELVIDLLPVETQAGLAYLPKPGGAPANVAAGVARLGHRAAMISKIGTEIFGEMALSALRATGVSVGGIVQSSEHNTALAVVSETATGEADFFFYRENCADSNLSSLEVPAELVAASRVLHVGTLQLATPVSAAAQRHAICVAKQAGVLVSTDPNFRPAFWRDPDRMRAAGLEVVGSANIVKVSQAELTLLTGLADTEQAARSLWHPALMVMAVTKGAEGADLLTKDLIATVPGFVVTPIDTVGCGDAFSACLLASLLDTGLRLDLAGQLRGIAARCCAAGAIMATRTGALESMPSNEAIIEFVRVSEGIP